MPKEPIFVYLEDDALSREIMEMLLKHRLNYSQITIFEDSNNFMGRLEALQENPTLFFLDIHVKPHDGFEILQLLRKHDQYAHAKIVAVTASVMNEEVEALQTAGFDGVISKPIDPDTFPDIIAAILAGEKIWQLSF